MRERKVSCTMRLPAELLDRVDEVARRDYTDRSAALRRLIRLGLESDARREQTEPSASQKQPVEAAS